MVQHKKDSFWGKFWAKNGPCRPPRGPPCNESTQNCCLFGVPSQWEQFFWISFRPKNSIFDPKKGHFGQSGCKAARRAAERPPTRKPKVSRVTSGYGGDMIPSSRVRLSPKKGGYMAGCSVKINWFLGQKCSLLAQNQFFGDIIQIFWCHHGGPLKGQLFCYDWVARRFSKRPPGPIFGPKICIFLRYAHITPIFWARTDPTGIISSPHPEVTMDNFGFPVGGRSAARRAVFRPPGRILAFFDDSHFAFWSTPNFGPRSTKLGWNTGGTKLWRNGRFCVWPKSEKWAKNPFFAIATTQSCLNFYYLGKLYTFSFWQLCLVVAGTRSGVESATFFLGPKIRILARKSGFWYGTLIFVKEAYVRLGVGSVLALGRSNLIVSFPSYARFREGTRLTRQQVLPHPTVRTPSASNSPSAVSAQAQIR